MRRMHLRKGLSIKEIERRTGMATNTMRTWLRSGQSREPSYPAQVTPTKFDGYRETLGTWLKANHHQNKH